MKKRLLFAFAVAASSVMGAMAHEINDYVFTNVARFQISGGNLVTNGNFADKFTGWTAFDENGADAVFTINEGTGPNGSNTIQVLEGQTALTQGIYQAVNIESAGTYVISMDVMNMAGAGFTDLDLTGGNTNYINAYFNCDGALATVSGSNNVNLDYGKLSDGETNGIGAGYGFSYLSDKFTNIVFSVEAPSDGKIIIDLRGLAAGLEIANVEVHAANEVFDIRTPQSRIDWIKTILNGFNWTGEEEYYEDVQDAIATLEASIKAEAWEQVPTDLENLNSMIAEFLAINAENVLDLIPTKDGSANTGNNSANWMNWTAKYNKLQSDYNGKAPWSWNTDRWAHKTAAAENPMQIQWMRSSSGTWNNIATCTAKLAKGVYFWGVSGSGGMMTLNKNRWARSMANACAETELFFNGDTISVGVLDPAKYQDYLVKFEVAEDDTELTFGIRCNLDYSVNPASSGFDVNFLSPVLYKMIEAGQLTEAQKAYLAAVETQLNAFEGRFPVAKEAIADPGKPWGREALQGVIDEAQKRLEAFKAWSQDEILTMMDDMKAEYTGANPDSTYSYINNTNAAPDLVMNAGVRYINNFGINPFNEMNKPLTDMPAAIQAANDVLAMRIYESGDQATFKAAISKAQALYDEKIVAAFSSEDSLALVNEKIALEDAVEAYKASADQTVVCSMDFEEKSIVTHEDPTGETETYYTIEGNNCEMVLTAISSGTGGTNFQLGYNDAEELGKLRVGNGRATIDLSGVPVKASDIVKVSFDFYWGNLVTKNGGFFLNDAAGKEIASFYYSTYSNTIIADGDNTGDVFDIMHSEFGDGSKWVGGVGSSSASNVAIAADGNKSHIEVILDYGKREKSMTISHPSKGTHTTQILPLAAEDVPAQFVVLSNYNNSDRRCWFDNFEVSNIAANETDAAAVKAQAEAQAEVVKMVENNAIVIKAAGKVYNVAGAQMK